MFKPKTPHQQKKTEPRRLARLADQTPSELLRRTMRQTMLLEQDVLRRKKAAAKGRKTNVEVETSSSVEKMTTI